MIKQRYFSIFLPKAIFDFIRIKPVRVADERKMAGESSLTPAIFVSADRTAIGQFILMESIFHLLKKSERLDFTRILIVVVSLDLSFRPRTEVHENADRESCATKIAEKLVLLHVGNILDGLAFHHDISSISFYHQIHLEI